MLDLRKEREYFISRAEDITKEIGEMARSTVGVNFTIPVVFLHTRVFGSTRNFTGMASYIMRTLIMASM